MAGYSVPKGNDDERGSGSNNRIDRLDLGDFPEALLKRSRHQLLRPLAGRAREVGFDSGGPNLDEGFFR